ncbi:MAG: hypothetical protein M3N05_04540 [Pseudomonadota bacterium]|nr:hypothetical protein [Pseudomonadota bacterium]
MPLDGGDASPHGWRMSGADKSNPKAEREAALAKALRANLRRRKTPPPQTAAPQTPLQPTAERDRPVLRQAQDEAE